MHALSRAIDSEVINIMGHLCLICIWKCLKGKAGNSGCSCKCRQARYFLPSQKVVEPFHCFKEGEKKNSSRLQSFNMLAFGSCVLQQAEHTSGTFSFPSEYPKGCHSPLFTLYCLLYKKMPLQAPERTLHSGTWV